jgi:hypothetical protein
MKARRLDRAQIIQPYTVGDLLLEADRASARGPVLLRPLSGTSGADPEKEKLEKFLDIVKPSEEDYPALLKTLQILKLGEDDLTSYHRALGTVVGMASSMLWAYGAILSVVNYLGTLLGDEKDAVSSQLESLSQNVRQIYGYLAQRERRGLHDEASGWRADLTLARRAAQRARASRSPQNIEELRDLARACDRNLLLMLDPSKGDIAFLRGVYGWKGGPGQGGHWIDVAVSPYMKTSAGGAIDYRSPSQELQATIWDPGHYLDVLVQALNDRLLLAAALEPAFRTTGHGLGNLKDISDGLLKFLTKWRSSFLIADPAVGLNNGGELLSPITDAPPGIAIGAADPVTGVSFCVPFWTDFTLLSIWHPSIEAKGAPDETRAKDPKAALAAALDLQPRLQRGAIAASGIAKLAELRSRLQAILTRSTIESDFVDLPNATFDRLELSGPQPVEPVELGFIGDYSKNPGKKYAATRHAQRFTKKFRFAMPLRGDVSLIQPGYRMEVGGQSIEVIAFDNAPVGGGSAPRFPTQPIAEPLHWDNITVYDVYQSRVFSEAEEDRFEGADPALRLDPSSHASAGLGQFRDAVRGTAAGAPFDMDIVRPQTRPERLFLNERSGYAAVQVDIAFDADLDSPDYPFAGYATVTITAADAERFRDGIILPITVYETRVDADGVRAEWMADRMTIHMVPGFYVVDPGYFADRRDGLEAMDTIFGGINDKYVRHEPIGPVGPEWAMRRKFLIEQEKVAAVQRFVREEGDVAQRALERFRVPRIR